MRQRYYNTEIKRFINQDVIRGSMGNSQSLNRYSYVQGNPVSYTDPFGLSPINGLFSGTNAIHNALLIGSIVLPEPFGAMCDFIDGTIYLLVDHDVANALGSYASIVAPGAIGLAFRGINKLHDMSKSGMMISKLLGRVSAEATQYGDDLASYWFKSDAQKFVPEVSKADELGSLAKIDDDVLDLQKASGSTSTSEAVAGNMELRSDPETYFDYMAKRGDVDPDGFFDIVVHGAENCVQIQINGKIMNVDHRFIGNMLKHSNDYNGQPIRLLSCNTGSLDNGFAQNLANYMNVTVEAPTKYVWAFPNGSHTIAGGIRVNGKLRMKPNDIGIMKKFLPGNK